MLAFAAIADTPLADDTEFRFIAVPAASVSVAGVAPDQAGSALRIFPPAANAGVVGATPEVLTGVTVKPESGRITLIKRAPSSVSTGVQMSPDALEAYLVDWARPIVLTGIFSERRIVFVDLRQTGDDL